MTQPIEPHEALTDDELLFKWVTGQLAMYQLYSFLTDPETPRKIEELNKRIRETVWNGVQSVREQESQTVRETEQGKGTQ